MSDLENETKGFSFIDKLAYVVENGELEFWEDRKNPPNLSVDEFKLVMARVDEAINFKWITRESDKGKHGKTGEDDCFKFNCKVEFGGIFEIETKYYFVKGYFFHKENLEGVTIQSFREEQL
jgi:hypothetical protein